MYISSSELASKQWGQLISLSLFIVALAAPFVGAQADRGRCRFWIFLIVNAFFVLSVLCIALANNLSLMAFGTLVVISTASFGVCLFLYDSLIPGIFSQNEAMRESGKGWALGYFGGFACLFLIYVFLGFQLPQNEADYKKGFLIIVCFFVVFSMPLLYRLALEAPLVEASFLESRGSLIADVRQTFADIVRDKYMSLYFVCALAMMDGLTTLTFFISIYAKSVLGFEIHQIVLLLVIVQLVAVPSTLIVSRMAAKVGEPIVLLYMAVLWFMVTVLIFIAESLYSFCVAALLAGTLLGSTPAVLRGWYSNLIPVSARSKYFGFNAMATRVSSILGPLVYVFLATVISERIAIFSVVPFFMFAILCLLKLPKNPVDRTSNSLSGQ